METNDTSTVEAEVAAVPAPAEEKVMPALGSVSLTGPGIGTVADALWADAMRGSLHSGSL